MQQKPREVRFTTTQPSREKSPLTSPFVIDAKERRILYNLAQQIETSGRD